MCQINGFISSLLACVRFHKNNLVNASLESGITAEYKTQASALKSSTKT